MKLILLSSIFCIFAVEALAKDKVLGRRYYNNFLGHVHKNMDKNSTSLTIVQCSHSVKVLKSPRNKNLIPGWAYVQVGDDKGYVQTKFLSSKRPRCLQEKYPKFYQNLDLDITEMYFWGRLYDHYYEGKSRIR